jgi:multisubunit Na+/H+ antiporter MnhG subunit
MGILTILCGAIMLILGIGGLLRKQSLLPEIKASEAALVTLPFGAIITVIGVIIQTKA